MGQVTECARPGESSQLVGGDPLQGHLVLVVLDLQGKGHLPRDAVGHQECGLTQGLLLAPNFRLCLFSFVTS